MQGEERRIIEARSAAVAAALAKFGDQPWETRAREAAAQLTAIHDDWWDRHEADHDAYARDLLKLNKLAAWPGPYASVSTVVRGKPFLTPPKFFGGDPTQLHQDFVLGISLNHTAPNMDGYLAQLLDFQTRDSCLKANRDYFRQAYVYGVFFKPRARVLGAYAAARGLEVPEDWRVTNERYSLYFELYPTTSQKCQQSSAPLSRLEAEVFVMALNRLAHEVVLGLLRPRAVLLAGKATWSLLRSSKPTYVSAKCLGTLDHIELNSAAGPSAVVRCNFLRTVRGPNKNTELEELGRLLAGSKLVLDNIGDPQPTPNSHIVSETDDWSHSVARAARREKTVSNFNLTETQEMQLDYWIVFHKSLGGRVPGDRMPRPEIAMGYPIGRTDFTLYAVMDRPRNKVRAELYLTGANAKAFFHLLTQQKAEIEGDLGFALDWDERPAKDRRISISLDDADPENKTDWTRQHEWLAKQLIEMRRVLAPRVQGTSSFRGKLRAHHSCRIGYSGCFIRPPRAGPHIRSISPESLTLSCPRDVRSRRFCCHKFGFLEGRFSTPTCLFGA